MIKIKETFSVGRPAAFKTINMVTRPASGILAAPTAARDAVVAIRIIWTLVSSIPEIWAMKTAATASYKAVPFMFKVVPRGSTKLAFLRATPFSIVDSMVIGNAAALEAVEKAVRSAAHIPVKYLQTPIFGLPKK